MSVGALRLLRGESGRPGALAQGRGNELQFKSQLKGLSYLSTYLFRVSFDLDVWVGLDFYCCFRFQGCGINGKRCQWWLVFDCICPLYCYGLWLLRYEIMREGGGQDATASKVPIGKQYGSTVR